MFWVFARLRKVGIGGFQHRILVPMSQLTLHRSIATGLRLLVLFDRAFAAILISGHI
jgi:hypothetical protein